MHEPWLREDQASATAISCATGWCWAALLSAADYLAAQKQRRELVRRTGRRPCGLDLLLTAAQPAEAPPIESVPKWAFLDKPNLTIPFNVTGRPGLTLCTGFGEGGLPVARSSSASPSRRRWSFAPATPSSVGPRPNGGDRLCRLLSAQRSRRNRQPQRRSSLRPPARHPSAPTTPASAASKARRPASLGLAP